MTEASDHKGIDDLIAVMAALRTPVTGCPWDLEQNFRTIAPYTVEEAYEVADAIERGDMADLREELGDLLLQSIYHARLAEEAGYLHLCRCRRRDHPQDGAPAPARVRRRARPFRRGRQRLLGDRSRRRRRPRRQRCAPSSAAPADSPGAGQAVSSLRADAALPEAPDRSLLDEVPLNMPALTRSVKLQEKAARVGFDWPGIAPVFDKIREEIDELDAAIATGSADAIEDEYGDLLFVMANLARHLKVDPEAALRRTAEKFRRRFVHIEQRLAADGRTPAQSDSGRDGPLVDRGEGRASAVLLSFPTAKLDRSTFSLSPAAAQVFCCGTRDGHRSDDDAVVGEALFELSLPIRVDADFEVLAAVFGRAADEQRGRWHAARPSTRPLAPERRS